TQGVTGIDPRGDTIFQTLYNINSGSDPADPEVVFAAVVMNVLRGTCGPGSLSFGGCDYHTGVQPDGDQADLKIGQEIGRAVEAAHQLQKPLFLEILTDGGIVSDTNTRNWISDSTD